MRPARSLRDRPASEDLWPPGSKSDPIPGAGVFGMRLFLVSLVMPFAACLIGYLKVRYSVTDWLPAGSNPISPLFALSTLFILLASLSVHLSLRAAREDRLPRVRRHLWLTLGFGVAFLVCQLFGWRVMAAAHLDHGVRMFTATFFLLTGLHAMHVVGGFALHGFVLLQAHRGRYWSYYHPGLTYNAMYWHFLDVMWLVVFATLLLAT